MSDERDPLGVFFDMDGTIVDTEQHYLDAAEGLAFDVGVVLTDDERSSLIGANLWDVATLLRARGVPGEAQELVHTIVAYVEGRVSEAIPWRPGAKELLAEIRRAGIPTALVTMSFGSLARRVVESIPFDAFDCIVAGDDVAKGKPDPEAYLTAAARLGLPLDECIIIEDSPPGVAAGVAAGAVVIAVPFYSSLPPSADYVIWNDLSGRGLSEIRAVMVAARA